MSVFHFKHFRIYQNNSALKVGTDAMVFGASIDASNAKSCLDIGAGTGVLSLMIAQEFSEVSIDAIEIDQASFYECEENFRQSSWKERLEAIHGDFINTELGKYDLIVSNPPYYQTKLESSDFRQTQAKHMQDMTPEILLRKSNSILNQSGSVWLIVSTIHVEAWISEAEKNNLFLKSNKSIVGKEDGDIIRNILQFTRNANESCKNSQLTIRNRQGNYTNSYKELTKEFHGVTLR